MHKRWYVLFCIVCILGTGVPGIIKAGNNPGLQTYLSSSDHIRNTDLFAQSFNADVSRYILHTTTMSQESMIHMAKIYAPILWFYKDRLWKEPFTLIEADYFINCSTLVDGNYHLCQNDYSGAQTLQNQYDGAKNPVYIRITTDEYQEEHYIVIQYWFHYLYNYTGSFSALNMDHQGEWEMIEVILTYSPDILKGTDYPEPYMVAYSRHYTGEAHFWNSKSVEKELTNGYHPVAYIAYGTHAAYFKDLGWNEDLNKGISVSYDDMTFFCIENTEWFSFSGRWGCHQNSPLGPQLQGDKWSHPVEWAKTHMDAYQFHLGDSGYLTLTNDENQKIGMVNGEYINEIKGAYAVFKDNHTYYYVPKDEYTIEIAPRTEQIDFDIITFENGEKVHISYDDEKVTHIINKCAEISNNINFLKIHARESLFPEIDEENLPLLFRVLLVALVIVLVLKLKR